MLEVLVGYVVTSYFTYFYEQAGLLADQAFDMSVSQCCIRWMCACVAFYLNGKLHRRTILIPGLTILTLIMLTTGLISIPHQKKSFGWAESVSCLLWWSLSQLTVAPVTYIIIGETAFAKLRHRAIGMGRIILLQYICNDL
jgi:hypothetical protein